MARTVEEVRPLPASTPKGTDLQLRVPPLLLELWKSPDVLTSVRCNKHKTAAWLPPRLRSTRTRLPLLPPPTHRAVGFLRLVKPHKLTSEDNRDMTADQ
jgi:hypothetical protein